MGPWGIAALVATATFATKTGRTFAKEVLKTGLRAGFQAKEAVTELADKAKECTEEFIADAKAEDKKAQSKKKSKAAEH